MWHNVYHRAHKEIAAAAITALIGGGGSSISSFSKFAWVLSGRGAGGQQQEA
jgi:hypothetical protein